VVETGGLENRCTRKGIGGSNPSPSATHSLGRKQLSRSSALWSAFCAPHLENKVENNWPGPLQTAVSWLRLRLVWRS
jgi:hypothetical protein